jgi:PIN domain nuclease of toxin-antitoxin system
LKILLDTHILLWNLNADPRLTQKALSYLHDPENTIFVSSISVWEMATKLKTNKLQLAVSLSELLTILKQDGLEPLEFQWDHARAAGELPLHHQDPFDRGLIAQAMTEPMHLMTHADWFDPYQVSVIKV